MSMIHLKLLTGILFGISLAYGSEVNIQDLSVVLNSLGNNRTL